MSTEANQNKIDEATLIDMLRKEAQNVKDCFTRFSFQGLAFSTAILSAIARYQFDHPFIGLSSFGVIVLLLVITRIGTYKYATANRHFGYELHLQRSLHMTDRPGGWQQRMREIGWEEAVRAWRVVQATQFRYLYHTMPMWPNNRKKKPKPDLKIGEYEWFVPAKLVGEGKYHAGSYLKSMLAVFYLMIILACSSSIAMIFQLWFKYPENHGILLLTILFELIILVIIVLRIIGNNRRRKILEEEILSIHSCGIMWQAVVIAHFRAIAALALSNSDGNGNLKNYTHELAKQAVDLRENIFRIHAWIDGTCGMNPKKNSED